jgi:glycosyltransferase involved in cell wall biosynthesis
LVKCDLPESYEELVVIENGSQAGAAQMVAELPERLNARYVHRERANKSFALNEALETVTGGLVVFFDDDVYVHENTLIAYAEAAKEHGTGYYFGGPVDVDLEREPEQWLDPLLPYSVKGYDLEENRMRNEYLGFNWAAYLCDVRRVGGFDPNFGPGSPLGATGQESNMQKRMMENGIKGRDVRKALVSHYVPKNRSNIKWLLNRSFRSGVCDGIYKERFIYIFPILKRLFKYLIRWILYSVVGEKKEIVYTKAAILREAGFARGVLFGETDSHR